MAVQNGAPPRDGRKYVIPDPRNVASVRVTKAPKVEYEDDPNYVHLKRRKAKPPRKRKR